MSVWGQVPKPSRTVPDRKLLPQFMFMWLGTFLRERFLVFFIVKVRQGGRRESGTLYLNLLLVSFVRLWINFSRAFFLWQAEKLIQRRTEKKVGFLGAERWSNSGDCQLARLPFYELSKCDSEPTHDPEHISFFTLSLLFVNAEHVALIWMVFGPFSLVFSQFMRYLCKTIRHWWRCSRTKPGRLGGSVLGEPR